MAQGGGGARGTDPCWVAIRYADTRVITEHLCPDRGEHWEYASSCVPNRVEDRPAATRLHRAIQLQTEYGDSELLDELKMEWRRMNLATGKENWKKKMERQDKRMRKKGKSPGSDVDSEESDDDRFCDSLTLSSRFSRYTNYDDGLENHGDLDIENLTVAEMYTWVHWMDGMNAHQREIQLMLG